MRLRRPRAPACEPPSEDDRVAGFRAEGDRIAELKVELGNLVAEQVIHILELAVMNKKQPEIAEICRVGQPYVSRVLKRHS